MNGLQGLQQEQLYRRIRIPRRLIHDPQDNHSSSRSSLSSYSYGSFPVTKSKEPCKYFFTQRGCMRGSNCWYSHDPGDQLCEVITEVTPTNQYGGRDTWAVQKAPSSELPTVTNPPQQHPHIPHIRPRVREGCRSRSGPPKNKITKQQIEESHAAQAKAEREKLDKVYAAVAKKSESLMPSKKRVIVMSISSSQPVVNGPKSSTEAATPQESKCIVVVH